MQLHAHCDIYLISSHMKWGAICFGVVSEAASASNFVQKFSPRGLHGFHSNFTWLLPWTVRIAERKMVDLDPLFKVTDVKLWPFFSVFAYFLQGYITDSIQTLHDCCLGQGAVQLERWLTLTYFSRSQRSNFDLFLCFCTFYQKFVVFIPAN